MLKNSFALSQERLTLFSARMMLQCPTCLPTSKLSSLQKQDLLVLLNNFYMVLVNFFSSECICLGGTSVLIFLISPFNFPPIFTNSRHFPEIFIQFNEYSRKPQRQSSAASGGQRSVILEGNGGISSNPPSTCCI